MWPCEGVSKTQPANNKGEALGLHHQAGVPLTLVRWPGASSSQKPDGEASKSKRGPPGQATGALENKSPHLLRLGPQTPPALSFRAEI